MDHDVWKKLKVSEPLITSLPKHANLMSILADHRCFAEWAFLNHSQLSFVPDAKGVGWLDFHKPHSRHHYRLTRTEYWSRETAMANRLDIVDFLTNAIDQDRYAYLMLDTYCIPAYKMNYQTYHIYHDCFIHGYDLRNKTFYASDFFNVSYGQESLPFEQVKSAFYSAHPMDDPFDGFTGVQLIRVNEAETFVYDRDYCIERLKDYAESRRTNDRFRFFEETYEALFGLAACEAQIDEIERNRSQDHALTCLKALHILYDHKRIMSFGVGYLLQNGHIRSPLLLREFSEIEKAAHGARQQYMKFLMTTDEQRKRQALDAHREILLLEKNVYPRLIAELG